MNSGLQHVSLRARLLLALLFSVGVAVAVLSLGLFWFEELRYGLALSAVASLISALATFSVCSRNTFKRIDSIHSGLLNLLDGDFSVTLHNDRDDEMAELVALFNQVSEKLRIERQTLYQRELMLDTVMHNSGLLLLLCDARNRIVFHSRNIGQFLGRQLPGQSLALTGLEILVALEHAPEDLRNLIKTRKDGLFDARFGGEIRIWHLSVGRFFLNAAEHHLYLIKDMTREINRQEANVWKKAIRVISHELNNTLAPISSMSHSGRVLLSKQQYDLLPKVLETIAERSEHLKVFVDRYAGIARLPPPNRQQTNWDHIIEGVNGIYPFTLRGRLPQTPIDVDVPQVQQLLLNLLKNASESGSPPADIELQVMQTPTHSIIQVLDRGCGMTNEVLLNAINPYFSTKTDGSGVGLTLCREIVDAHGGTFCIANRSGGGIAVRVELPVQET